MGAVFNSTIFSAQSEQELKRSFAWTVEDAKYDHGHAGYSGSFAEARSGIAVKANVFKSVNDAEEWIQDHHHSRYDPLLAVRVGDMTKSFRFSAKGKELAQKIETLTAEVKGFEIAYFKAQKREFMGCPSCGSKLHRLTLLKRGTFSGDCPVCSKSLIPTTAMSKKVAMEKKLSDSSRIMKEKMEKEKGKIAWVVGGWLSY